MKEFKFKPGDEVLITGKIYQSANGTLYGKTLNKFKATIKKIAEKGAHPYAIEGMWGWFDEKELSPYVAPPEISVGDKVKLIKNETYNHKKIVLSPYIDYQVNNIEDNKVYVSFRDTNFIVDIYNLKKI